MSKCDFNKVAKSTSVRLLLNVNKVIIGNLNINSLPNNFDLLREIVLKYVEFLLLRKPKSMIHS